MLIRLLDKLRIVRGVWLRDFEGDIYETWEIRGYDPFKPDCKHARVFPFMRVGRVTLNDDGTTGGRSSFITHWKYMSERS